MVNYNMDIEKLRPHFNHWKSLPVSITDKELKIGDFQVMQSWELPIMDAMAKAVTHNNGSVLEIGFGLGISASRILDYGCSDYTVIEAHPDVVKFANEWAKSRQIPVKIIEGFWQEILPDIKEDYDGILFDTYPLNEAERSKNHYEFIPLAPKYLKSGGILTYYSDETVDFRSEHLRLLLQSFDEVCLKKIGGLQPPPNCNYWKHDHMIIPIARYSASGS